MLEGRLSAIEDKLREVDVQRIEPEREHQLKCGRLEPPMGGDWR